MGNAGVTCTAARCRCFVYGIKILNQIGTESQKRKAGEAMSDYRPDYLCGKQECEANVRALVAEYKASADAMALELTAAREEAGRLREAAEHVLFAVKNHIGGVEAINKLEHALHDFTAPAKTCRWKCVMRIYIWDCGGTNEVMPPDGKCPGCGKPIEEAKGEGE
jgi:hypothetical protein